MRSHLHGDAAPWTRPEGSQHRFLVRRHAFFHHRALLIQHAIPAGLVAQVHSDRVRSFRGAAFPRPFRTLLTGATLLHGWSPSLHFECAFMGSLTHPARLTGLLIPSPKWVGAQRLFALFHV